MGDRPVPPGGWVCFHCDEICRTEAEARLHFGPDEGHQPACQIKAGAEGSLLRALRAAEASAAEAWAMIHSEGADVVRAWRSAEGRHGQALQAAEELGYERGLRDARAEANP